jgi:hypothetical protein
MSDAPRIGVDIHRQKIEIDLTQLSKLGAFQATLNEVAAWFDVAPATIDRRLEEDTTYDFDGRQLTFRQIFENGKLKGKANLRRLQMIQAEKGNATMLIWLGKQLLGQKDNLELGGPGGGPIEVTTATPARELLAARIARENERTGSREGTGRPE